MRQLLSNKKNILGLSALGIVVALVSTLTACGKAVEPFKDAPGSNVVNSTPADKILMPDGFSNAVTKCDHGNRLYIAFHGNSAYAAIAVVAADPTCK